MKFDIIYVEEKIKDNLNTKKILQRINYNKIIFCENYSQIFNSKNQNFRIQKAKPSIILAKKEGNLILKTPPKFSIGFDQNFYFSHMLNCVYDCKYCFLQGMFNSAHYLIFVNFSDFIEEIEKITTNSTKNICFFSGYDCDSLALEKITHFLSFFLKRFKKIKNGVLEIRTKSTQIDIFRKIKPIKNVIIAFSLNPKDVIEKYEDKTPKLIHRIKALIELQNLGWSIGIRFDPLIVNSQNNQYLSNFFELVFEKIDAKKLHSVTIGEFRMPNRFMEKFSSLRPFESSIFNKKNSEFRHLEIYEREICKFVNKKKVFRN